MHLTFLTPLGAVFALTALVPLGVAYGRRRRLRRVRSTLGLAGPALRTALVTLGALAAVPCLLAVAATQPVIETTRTLPQRTDAQAFIVMDNSRSMLAASGPHGATRFERARSAAERIADDLPDVPIGLASLTDRVLPYLFPTTDRQVIDATLQGAVEIEQPPPSDVYAGEATSLSALSAIPQLNYFTPAAKKRVVIVLTDGESQPVSGSLAAAYRTRPPISTIFVRFGNAGERIYTDGAVEGAYHPDKRSAADLARAASLTDGRVLSEDQIGAVASAVRKAIGQGPTVRVRHEGGRFPLMPLLTALVLLPLALVLVRRNLWWSGRPVARLRVSRAGRGRQRPILPEASVGEGAKVSEPRGVAQPG